MQYLTKKIKNVLIYLLTLHIISLQNTEEKLRNITYKHYTIGGTLMHQNNYVIKDNEGRYVHQANFNYDKEEGCYTYWSSNQLCSSGILVYPTIENALKVLEELYINQSKTKFNYVLGICNISEEEFWRATDKFPLKCEFDSKILNCKII